MGLDLTSHARRCLMAHLVEVVPDVFPSKDWAPNSPDENPAENSFGYLDSKVQEKGAQSLRVLKAIVTKAWKEITPDFVGRPSRLFPNASNTSSGPGVNMFMN